MALIEKLTAIADGFRTSRGTTQEYTLDEMAVLAAEEVGGGGGDIDALIEGSITEITSNAENIKTYSFTQCKKLTTAIFPVATAVFEYAFYDCTALTTAICPAATTVFRSGFSSCYKLQFIDLSACTSILSYAFNFCYSLTALILRSETMCKLSNTNAFNNCYHILGTVDSTYNPDGLKDGYIYVPSALVAEYQAATNWSTYASQFRALEDYTVDGTITGELDPEKI